VVAVVVVLLHLQIAVHDQGKKLSCRSELQSAHYVSSLQSDPIAAVAGASQLSLPLTGECGPCAALEARASRKFPLKPLVGPSHAHFYWSAAPIECVECAHQRSIGPRSSPGREECVTCSANWRSLRSALTIRSGPVSSLLLSSCQLACVYLHASFFLTASIFAAGLRLSHRLSVFISLPLSFSIIVKPDP